MQPATLRKLVAATIALLLVHQVGSWIAAFYGSFWGGAAALAVAAVSIAGLRLAGRSVAWFLVPAAAFAVVPLVARTWVALADEQATWVDHLVAATPMLVGFVVPVGLLLIVYIGLRGRPA